MTKIKDNLKQAENDGKQIEPVATPDSHDYSNKYPKRLGNGRWKYRGKTYKEESLGQVRDYSRVSQNEPD